mgnify:CR=1 FL=1
MAKEKKKLLFPILVGIGLLSVFVFLGTTDVISPLIQYLHTNSISPLAGAVCIIAGIAAFYTVFRILVKLGNTWLPEPEENRSEK